MKYMLLICRDQSITLDEDQRADMGRSSEAWITEMDGRGIRVLGHRLRPVDDATTVRVHRGETLVADGPFAETKEQIAGFDVIECADLDEAIEVAAKHPVARYGAIEVRPFWAD
jgi:hypothetical protein